MTVSFPHHTHFRFLDFRIEWYCNDADLFGILKEQFLYQPLRVDLDIRDTIRFYIRRVEGDKRENGKESDLQYHYEAEANRTQFRYLNGAIEANVYYEENRVEAHVSAAAFPYQAAIGNWVITLPLSELLKPFGYYFMHAACLTRANTGALFAGKSGSGKTTVALGLAEQGWDLIADDEVFIHAVKANFMAEGGPEKAKLTSQTRYLFRHRLGPSTTNSGKQIVNLGDYFSVDLLERGVIGKIFFLNKSDRVDLKPLKSVAVFERLLNLAFLSAHPLYTRANLDFIHRLSKALRGYELYTTLDFAEVNRRLCSEFGT